MSNAAYCVGLTIEGDEFPPKLTIDGRLVKGVTTDEDGHFLVSKCPEVKAKSLITVLSGCQ
jgi:hypothetical protein